ncbi:MAG TPA: hypothetical protein VL485_01255 [Ktedonobacteraceae bacterium]|nr:hypothetical protein [Ktedonobacteraceae bacterium]
MSIQYASTEEWFRCHDAGQWMAARVDGVAWDGIKRIPYLQWQTRRGNRVTRDR